MSKEAYDDFRKNWLKIYIKQYKLGNYRARREIKRNLYKNVNLTEYEKDRLWHLIIKM